jgi:hypothetical protein
MTLPPDYLLLSPRRSVLVILAKLIDRLASSPADGSICLVFRYLLVLPNRHKSTKNPCAIATLSPGVRVAKRIDALASIGGPMVKRKHLVSALCIGCTVLSSASSWATTIEPGQGNLSINQGQGFKSIQGRMTAKVGDSVMVGPGGVATVTYDDGCKVSVQPGAVTTIAPLSPCASGSNADNNWGWQDTVFWALFVGTGIFMGIEISRHAPASP